MKDIKLNTELQGTYGELRELPDPKLPEICFIGRSNVGKSSLLNMILDRKNLAYTSSKPGKTQTINYYRVNDNLILIDLPGIGYAKTARKKRKEWEKLIREYLTSRNSLYMAFYLVDASIPPNKIDLEFLNWMGGNKIPFTITMTKCDKEKSTVIHSNIKKLNTILAEYWEPLPPIIMTSAMEKKGRDEILEFFKKEKLI